MDVSTDIQLEQTNAELAEQRARITVIGVGGGGSNAVETMIQTGLQGVDYICANTDAQALCASSAKTKVQLGKNLTHGLGAGAKPEIGKAAAQENLDQIKDLLKGSQMVFITAGMGGGTGTGAAPVIAQIAQDMNILTVGVVTFPFAIEGRRAQVATEGIKELRQHVHSLIVIPNQRLVTLASPKSQFKDMLKLADSVLCNAVGGITELINRPGLINLDFMDVRSAMQDSGGMAMMGIGAAKGENRAMEAAKRAISSTLLDDVSIKGAKAILINITSDESLTMEEFQEISEYIKDAAQSEGVEPNMFIGTSLDNSIGDGIRISVIATGIEPQNIPTQSGKKVAVAPKNPGGTRTPVTPMSGSGPRVTGEASPQRPIVQNFGGIPQPDTPDFDNPSVFRRNIKIQQVQQVQPQHNPGALDTFTFDDDDDFDLPTCLRKQAN